MTLWTEILGGLITVGAIIGVILNNHRRRSCFIVWMFTNGATLAIHLSCGLYSLAARDFAFLILSVHGLTTWARLDRAANPEKESL